MTNKYRRLVLVLLLAVIAVGDGTMAQIIGKVIDQSGEPLPYATLQISSPDSHQVLAYTFSDVDGGFKFALEARYDTVRLEARMLGYQVYAARISSKSSSVVVQLVPSTDELEEIVVMEKTPPVIEKGDTTIYQTKDFSDSTETVLEEVLKKLPGFYIDDSGRIKIFGRELDVLLIEGSDMFGYDYTVATKNIRSHVIKSVEVIENYSDDPVLQPIYEDNRLAINLTLYDEHKGRINGTLLAGAGYGGELKGYGLGNVFYFDKKTKAVLLSNQQNIGEANGMTLDMDPTLDRWMRSLSTSVQLIPDEHIWTSGLDRRVVDNAVQVREDLRTDFSMGNHQVQIGVRYGLDDDDQRRSESQFIEDDLVFGSATDLMLDTRAVGVSGSHLYLSDRGTFSIKNRVALHQKKHEAVRMTRYANERAETNAPLHTQVLNENLAYGFSSVVSRRFGLSSAVVLKLHADDGRWDSDYHLMDDGRLDTLISYRTSLRQQLDRDQYQYGATLQGLQRWRDWVFLAHARIGHLEEEGSRYWKADQHGYGDEVSSELVREDLGGGLRVVYDDTHGTRLTIIGRVSDSDLQIDGQGEDAQWLYSGRVDYITQLSRRSRLDASIYTYRSRPAMHEVLRLSYLTDAFHLQTTGGLDELEQASGVSATYSYRRPTSQFVFSQRVGYVFDQDRWRQNVVQLDEYLTAGSPYFARNGATLNTFSNVSYFIRGINTNIQLNLRYLLSYADVQINERAYRQRNMQWRTRVKLSKLLFGILAANNTLSLEQDQYANNIEGSFINSFERQRLKNELALTLLPENWNISASWFHIYFSDQANSHLNRYALSLTHTTSRLGIVDTIRLRVENIGLDDAWTDRYSDGLITSISTIETVGPFFMITVNIGI